MGLFVRPHQPFGEERLEEGEVRMVVPLVQGRVVAGRILLREDNKINYDKRYSSNF